LHLVLDVISLCAILALFAVVGLVVRGVDNLGPTASVRRTRDGDQPR